MNKKIYSKVVCSFCFKNNVKHNCNFIKGRNGGVVCGECLPKLKKLLKVEDEIMAMKVGNVIYTSRVTCE